MLLTAQCMLQSFTRAIAPELTSRLYSVCNAYVKSASGVQKAWHPMLIALLRPVNLKASHEGTVGITKSGKPFAPQAYLREV